MFKDRFDAAEKLAEKLKNFKGKDCVVLAIPRGGLQIGNILAKKLKLPLDVVLTKKIGYPGNEEYAIGAVSLKGRILTADVEVSKSYIESETKRIRKLLQERYNLYRGKKKPFELRDKIAILVDDGIATGSTMLATIELVKEDKPKKIIVAIPVGPSEAIEMLKTKVDEVVCLETPLHFFAIGNFYEKFEQVDDEEAINLLREVNK